MGIFSSTLSRRTGGVEVVDIQSTNAYRYPPKTGNNKRMVCRQN